jgi:outer membrane protein TolC
MDMAGKNHQLSGNSEIIEDISVKKIQNIRAGNLPLLELNGRASYQSDVTGINLPLPGIKVPSSPKDQYKITLDVTQSIYDGGLTNNRQKIENAAERVDKSQLEIDIRSTKMQIKDLFYNIIIMQKNEEIIEVSLSQLIENKKAIETGIKNGVLLNTDRDLIDVEIINLQQRKAELENSRFVGLQVLSYKMGKNLSSNAILAPTNFSIPEDDSIRRIEEVLFEIQSEQLGMNKDLIKSRTRPKVFAFGQFGYGNPGLNMLMDKFDTYYVVGAGLKWTIWDWQTSDREKQVIGLQQNIVKNRRNQFETDIISALMNQKTIIQNHNENLKSFAEIVTLRNRITASAKKQLEQGTIRTLDFLIVLDQETIARIQFETEKTLLQQSIARYLEIKGEL